MFLCKEYLSTTSSICTPGHIGAKTGSFISPTMTIIIRGTFRYIISILRIALRKFFTKVLLGEFVHAYYYRHTRDTLHIINITAVVEAYVTTVYHKEFVNIIGIQYFNVCDSYSSRLRLTSTGLPALILEKNSHSNCINEQNSRFAGISSRCTPLHALAKMVRSRVVADGANGHGENCLRRP